MQGDFIKPAVWAPHKGKLQLWLGDRTAPMFRRPDGSGWWDARVPCPAGTRYAFLVDGAGPFPDPRSPSQPDGVHAPSEMIDHGSLQWTDHSWTPPPWEEAVVYELHVGTFSEEGTFAGIIPHLGGLIELGVSHIELMPVCEFPGRRGWGYDGVAIFAPHHAYGGVEGLFQLVDACHANGLAVIMDVVYNHLGPDGNYLPGYGPYFTDNYQTPWGDAPNLDGPESHEVRRFFIDNALMWLRDFHIDGLRLDAIDKVIDHSQKHFLVEMSEAVRALEAATGRKRVLIAESASNDPRFVLSAAHGGYGLDAQWSDDLHHSMRTVFTGEREGYLVDYGNIQDVVKALKHGFVYDGKYSVYRDRPHGSSPLGLPGHTFLGYIQNHDQVGNRATGDRFHHHPAMDPLHHRIAAAFVMLAPFVPMIFMGEEWAASTPFQYFTDHEDPELALAVTQGRRSEFGVIGWKPEDVPDPQQEPAFQSSKLRWSERGRGAHGAMLDWYRQLLALRKSDPQLGTTTMPNVEAAADPDGQWLWMRRGPYLVAAALRGKDITIPAPDLSGPEPLLAAGCEPRNLGGGRLHFSEPGIIITRKHHANPTPLS